MQKRTKIISENAGPSTSPDRVQVILEQLEEDIALGRLRPRERLIERDLAVRFGDKRHMVRQALASLETMGLIIRERNKGASVRDFSLAEVEDIYAVRELLEAKAAELIPLPNPGLVKELRQIHKMRLAAVQKGDLKAVFRGNLLFHRTMFKACNNPSLVEAINDFALKTHTIRSLPIGRPKLLSQVTAQHAAIIESLAKCNRAELVRNVIEHLLPAKIAYLEMHAQIFGED
jgi:DNA-binding GntR family transcriptional regulator